MQIAKDFLILRGIKADGRVSHALERKPLKVATLINEELFNSNGHGLLHNRTVFLEDQLHDWAWENGRFRYYSRVAGVADVLIVYELDDVYFCTQCGAKTASLETQCASCGHQPAHNKAPTPN
ncbi:TPA: hypothetical protein L5U90_003379 [Pseudomonas aeruginosa]|nr:hypothetical protein [Pseudomonas aeruginosa]